MGDFNIGKSDKPMDDFCIIYSLCRLIKVPTCYKNSSKPTYIDLILANSPQRFYNSCAIETEDNNEDNL